MITVKTLPVENTGSYGHWYMGADHMVRIGKNDARGLCGMYPMPKMGYVVTVALKRDTFGFMLRLEVQNVSGGYWLASCNTAKNEWPEIFGVCAT